MGKPNLKMPKEIQKKCAVPIHTASIAAGGSAAIPVPIADTIPITAAQVGMVVALGKVFDVTISDTVAKAVIGCGLAQSVGRSLSSSVLKAIPVVNIFIAPVVCTITAAGLTEALGWVIADDFYRMSIGEEPENIVSEVEKIKPLFNVFHESSNVKSTKNNKNTKKISNANSGKNTSNSKQISTKNKK